MASNPTQNWDAIAKDDQPLSELAVMFFAHEKPLTYKRYFLRQECLDLSVDSLKHIDEYLENLHSSPPQEVDDRLRTILRCGAYVGEVLRRNIIKEFHWVRFETAAKIVPFVDSLGKNIGTAAVLLCLPETVIFPLSKVEKFIQNGNEDSVHFYATALLGLYK